jgi:hypothetical protein
MPNEGLPSTVLVEPDEFINKTENLHFFAGDQEIAAMKAWVMRFNQIVGDSRHRNMRRAFDLLVSRGCEPELLMEWIYIYTMPWAQHPQDLHQSVFRDAKETIRHSQSDFAELAELLCEAEKRIQRLSSRPELMSLLRYYYGDFGRSLPIYNSYAQDLVKDCKRFCSEKGWGRNESCLLELAEYIKSVTGQTHTVRISHLIEAGYKAHGRDVAVRDDTVRRTIKTYGPMYRLYSQYLSIY